MEESPVKDSIITGDLMEYLKVSEKGRITDIQLNLPNPANPLTVDVLEEIQEVLKDEMKIAVISGMNKAFSAGANIKVFVDLEPKTAYEFSRRGQDVMNFLAERKMPVIAAIHGYALGGGMELALACDYRIAHPNTIMGLPEITLGILPGFAGTQRLRHLVGETKAFELATMGKKFGAEDAFKWGILNEISETYHERAMEVALQYEKLPKESLAYIKNLMRTKHDDLFTLEMEYFGRIFETANQKEGVKAFLEKREAKFNKE